MEIDSSEFSADAIGDDRLTPWPRVAAVAAMVGFSLPTFVTGLEVYTALSPKDAALALVLGSLIIFAIGAMMAVIGANTRLNSYLLVRIAFGDKGAGLVNIAFAISLLGWFGVNINLFADAVARLSGVLFGAAPSALTLSIIASICMTGLTFAGFRAINLLASVMVPVLAIVTALFIATALEAQSFGQMLSADKPAPLGLGDGVSAVVGAIIVGAIIVPDITRFVRHWSGALAVAFFAYVVVQIIVMGAASMGGATSQAGDVLGIMLELGLGLGAFAIVIAGSWILNSLNLYSTVLSTKATFPQLNTSLCVLGLGALGVGAALLNLLDHFLTFLFYLSVVFIPVAGVIIADYLLIRRNAYRVETLADNRQISPFGLVAWGAGAALAIAQSESLMPALTGIAALDAMALSATLYTLLAWRDRSANKGN